MLRHVLISIFALMYISGKLQTAIIYPSKNFLNEISDFDSIIEPENIQSGSNLETRQSSESEDNQNEDCPNGKCPQKQLLNDVEGQNRNFREIDEVEEGKRRQEEKDEEQAMIDYAIDPKSDREWANQLDEFNNVTNSTKEFFEKLEEPPNILEPQETVCCDEENPKSFVESAPKGRFRGSNDFLEMHFFKHLPESDSFKISPHPERPLLINFPKTKKSRKTQSPRYDYIALLPQEDQLVQVPAIKLSLVPDIRRRKDIFAPFMSKLKKSHSFKHRHNSHSSLVDEDQPEFDRVYKRFANFDVLNNKYLQEADFLIHSRSSQIRDNNFKDASNVDMKNTKQENSEASNIVKSEVSPPGLVDSEVNSVEGGQNLVDSNENVVKSEVSQMESGGSDEGLVKSEVGAMERGQSREEGLVKSEVGAMERGQIRDEGLAKSEVNDDLTKSLYNDPYE